MPVGEGMGMKTLGGFQWGKAKQVLQCVQQCGAFRLVGVGVSRQQAAKYTQVMVVGASLFVAGHCFAEGALLGIGDKVTEGLNGAQVMTFKATHQSVDRNVWVVGEVQQHVGKGGVEALTGHKAPVSVGALDGQPVAQQNTDKNPQQSTATETGWIKLHSLFLGLGFGVLVGFMAGFDWKRKG
jgi:hypothetical protein